MGVLGRPGRRKRSAVADAQLACETDGAVLLRRQMMGSDPVLARVAEEALLAEATLRGKTKIDASKARVSADLIVSICGPTPGRGQRYPTPPQGPVSASQRARYGRELAASIRARTASVLLSKDEVLTALDVKRLPAGLPSSQAEGRAVYKRDDVRTLLLGGTLPPSNRVPRCRCCGQVSHSGWAAMVCDRCEKMRAQIETGAMSHFAIAVQRGRTGPATIVDDELLSAIHRRLRDADHRAVETAEREKRHADRARRWAKDEAELEAAE
jgi:hypothetical protein